MPIMMMMMMMILHIHDSIKSLLRWKQENVGLPELQ
jgi:hypothetical protein